MFLIRIYNYLRGFLTITVEGYFVERFINICTRRNIYLWDIKRLGDSRMKMNISIPGYKKIATVSYKTRSGVKIVRKRGMPFLVQKYKKRTAFAAGILVFGIIIFCMTLFVWVVDVNGNENVATEEIVAQLEVAGLKPGLLRGQVDVDAIRNRAMLEMDDLVWIGINLKGTTAQVEVRERVQKPALVSEEKPSNIKAGRAGVIKNVDVTSGSKMANEGESVAAGQLLVSGVLDSKVLGARYVHSTARITAQTLREEIMEVIPYSEERVPTGKKKSQTTLQIFGFNINFFINPNISYAEYDTIYDVKRLTIGQDNVLPIALCKNTYTETATVRKDLTPEEAEALVIERLKSDLDEELGEGENVAVLNVETVKYVQEDGKTYVKMSYECLEDIGVQEEIIQ